MKTRYRLIHRGRGNGIFYCVDSKTGKRTSLGKATKEEARQIVDAKNQAERQPMLNLQLAKAYLAGTDAKMPKRGCAWLAEERAAALGSFTSTLASTM